MSILSSIPFFGLFGSRSSKSKHCKSIVPISTVLKRQPFSAQRALPNKSSTTTQKVTSEKNKKEIITENSILNSFPRPNLMPTLHPSLFANKSTVKCTNCSGPHSTDFCPC